MDTPKPMHGTWVLIAPDGRKYTGDSPIQVMRAEQAERVPAHVAVQRIVEGLLDTRPRKRSCKRR